ncbi:MAG: hypothetical protein A4E57_01391 [Syntrophorhabdaceae bacterium PtaU1.Bin034]|nr:MAG: hypothetical protein A4E57_01391 [Syntrophorhabdaceae bacterium PtaU1.Bin034]
MLLLLVFCLAGPIGCSSSKGAQKQKQSQAPFDNGLISAGQEDVLKKLGEPTIVSKTPDEHILWIYEPKWKLIPNDHGTVYVEFENGKVTKIFKKQ